MVITGEAIVTGAGDETLRFWNVFSKARSQKVPTLVIVYINITKPSSELSGSFERKCVDKQNRVTSTVPQL
jgi:WD40 repeat protein